MIKSSVWAAALLGVTSLTGTAAAQVSDVEVPTIVFETGDSATSGESGDEALDLANIVQSAAKNVTTVQEAPAIVTVITADEIKERQYQNLADLYDGVPGWQRLGLAHSNMIVPIVRGLVFGVQFLQDGLSLFDPFVNVPVANRVQPMETIKRVEMITGPGGVLWGSNSLLGILNIITKDAEDVEGVEVGGAVGDGKGDRMMARAYVMAGKSDFLDGKLKLFAHGSVETYQGAELENALLVFHEPLPQPNSLNKYGPLTTTQEAQSLAVNLDGKATWRGKLQLRVQYQVGKTYKPMGLSGQPVRDAATDPRWEGVTFDDSMRDPNGTGRKNAFNTFDRFAVLEYRDRLASGKAGITMRGYAQEFVRGFDSLQVLVPQASLLVGGLAFNTDLKSYRAGASFDGDVELAKPARVLYGAEAFHEWKPITTSNSLQGAGSQAEFIAPTDFNRLPIPCPRQWDTATMALVPVAGCPLTFAYDANRTVVGAYVNPQLRPSKKLILDAGARVQVAPEAGGSVGYPVNYTLGGAIVYNFIPNWHFKINYTQGFRPPVFNNTSSNGEGVVITGDPNLNVEKSDAAQVEVNARIFKGDRRIRELSFRIDGSYTRINNLIQVTTGSYKNSGDRGLSSVEFLGKLYIQGGHRVELAYTWMRAATADRGLLKSLPEHWFNLSTVFNLVTNRVSATTNLKVVGAMEDPNRLVEYRDSTYDPTGNPMGIVTSGPTDLVLDRLPPAAEISAGLQITPVDKLSIRATVYNALMSHSYQPDVFFDYEPHLEYLPNPYEGFRAYLSAMYQY